MNRPRAADAGAGDHGPLAAWAAAAWLGAAAATWAAAWAPVTRLAAVVTAGAGLALAAAAIRSGDRARFVVACLAVAVTLFGLAGARLAAQRVGPVAEAAHHGRTVRVAAVVAEDARRSDDGRWWTIVRVDRLAGAATRARAVIGGRGGPPPRRGVRLTGRVRVVWLEDGSPLRFRHVAVSLRGPPLAVVGAPDAVERGVARIRGRVRGAARSGLTAPLDALATGLVTGDDTDLPEDAREALRAAGLGHLTAVSGANVALVVGGVALLAGVTRWRPATRRLAAVVAIVAFVIVTRAEPSVVRAACMAGAVLAAEARGHARHAVAALATAVLASLLIDPLVARSVGFLLSVSATAGILVVAPRIRARLPARPGRLGDAVAVTLGASIGVTPGLLASFGEAPLASVPANIVAAPLAAVAFAVTTAAGVVAQVSEPAGAALMALAGPAVRGVLATARAAEAAGAPVLSTARPFLLVAAAAAVVALLVASAVARRLGLAVAVGASVVVLAPGPGREGLVLTALDVGQGDALLVETPDVRILVDAGPDDTAATWLRRRPDLRPDLLVVSHPHADHVGGLRDVLDGVGVPVLWRPPPTEPAASFETTLAAAAERGTAVVRAAAGRTVRVGETRIDVLGPPPGRPYAGTASELNESSLVVRVAWRGRAALLTGDAEAAAQRDLLRRPGAIRAGLLKVPHHGAATNAPGFLRAVGAEVAVISVGADNDYGHPRKEVLDDLRTAGVEVLRTDRDGEVRAFAPPNGAETAATGRLATPSLPVEEPRWAAGPRLA